MKRMAALSSLLIRFCNNNNTSNSTLDCKIQMTLTKGTDHDETGWHKASTALKNGQERQQRSKACALLGAESMKVF